MKVKVLVAQLYSTLWDPMNCIACQAPLSMGFSRQEYWNGLPFPSPGDLHDPGIESASPVLAGRFFTTEPPGKPQYFSAAAAAKSLQSCPTLCDPVDVIRQVPLSMGFSRQEYWNGLPFPSPGNLPGPGIEPGSPALQADSWPSEPPGKSILCM